MLQIEITLGFLKKYWGMGMLFSFLNIDKSTELKFRRLKAEKQRLTKRILKLIKRMKESDSLRLPSLWRCLSVVSLRIV